MIDPSHIVPSGLPESALEALRSLGATMFVACQAGLALYSSHRYAVLFHAARSRVPGTKRAPALEPGESAPFVTVQLPVFNEPLVVERLIDAAAALEYPGERLEIQVLDDSTDVTSAKAALAIASHRARGVDIAHVRRAHRQGFKAGALAHGLALARGELVAIFDADFVPAPDFLRRMTPHFRDARVGMAQARWGHLNRDSNALTSAQAVLLDAHFLLEHSVRMARGLFFNFNGTAGVWRRACIEDAGGWSHETLTEDLDLSYRAQLKGWRFVFDPEVVVPAELPSNMPAFQSQQRRWARGSIQTARRVLPRLAFSSLPWRVRLEAFFHLTSNAAYPLLVGVSLLLLPVMLETSVLPPALVWGLQALTLLLGIVPVVLFLVRGQRSERARGVARFRDVAAALVLGVGMSWSNATAVLRGLGGAVGGFERTPKSGERSGQRVRPRREPRSSGRGGRAEIALALYFASVLAWSAGSGRLSAVPFLALLVAGYAWVGLDARFDRRPAG